MAVSFEIKRLQAEKLDISIGVGMDWEKEFQCPSMLVILTSLYLVVGDWPTQIDHMNDLCQVIAAELNGHPMKT